MATMGASEGTVRAFRLALPVMRPLFRRNMGMDRSQLELARSRLGLYVDRIEAELNDQGHLVGDRFGVADLAVASVMTAILRPPEFSYPLPEPQAPGLVELRESIAARTGCRWVFDTYRRHRGRSAEIVAA
jgi:glutathione S-transferase